MLVMWGGGGGGAVADIVRFSTSTAGPIIN